MRARLGVALPLKVRGYRVVLGDCLGTDGVVVGAQGAAGGRSSPRCSRTPRSGRWCRPGAAKLAIDLLDGSPGTGWPTRSRRGWSATATSTVMLPVTVHLGWATLHGQT